MSRERIGFFKSYAVLLNAAHDNRHGDGASVIVTASLTNVLGPTGQVSPKENNLGVQIDRVRIQPLAEFASDAYVRLFLDMPGRGRFLMHEQKMPAGSLPRAPLDSDEDYAGVVDLTAFDGLGGSIYLQPGLSLLASCSTADPVNVIAFGGEFTLDEA